MTHDLTRRFAATAAATGLLAAGLLASSPAPQAGAATVVTGTATTTASIRAGAGEETALLGTLAPGQRIPTATSSQGWVQVRFRRATAFVRADQLAAAGVAAPAPPTTIGGGTKVATVALHVRSGPATAKSSVGRVAEGGTVKATGRTSHGFAEVTWAAHRRWVSVRYLATPATSAAAQQALAFATAQLGKPYRYGATGPKAFDCSGLTQASWGAAGVTIPRTAAQQFTLGTKVAKADLQPGDLVFFYGKTPSHVAIYVGEGRIIHAPRPGKTVEYSQLSYMPWSGARRPS